MLYRELKNGLIANHYNLAGNEYWTETQEKRNRMTEFVKKYFTEVPEDATSITEEYKAYLAAQGNLLVSAGFGFSLSDHRRDAKLYHE